MTMETSAWILIFMRSIMLLIFLIISIILLVKVIQLIKETRKIVDVSQGIVNKADDIVDNVKQVSAVGGIVKVVTDAFVSGFVASKKGKKTDSKKEKK